MHSLVPRPISQLLMLHNLLPLLVCNIKSRGPRDEARAACVDDSNLYSSNGADTFLQLASYTAVLKLVYLHENNSTQHAHYNQTTCSVPRPFSLTEGGIC